MKKKQQEIEERKAKIKIKIKIKVEIFRRNFKLFLAQSTQKKVNLFIVTQADKLAKKPPSAAQIIYIFDRVCVYVLICVFWKTIEIPQQFVSLISLFKRDS